MGSQVSCVTCKMDIGNQDGNAAVGALFNHAELHEMDEHVIPKTCSFPTCLGVEFQSLLNIRYSNYIRSKSNMKKLFKKIYDIKI